MAALEDGVAREHKCRRITKTVVQLIVDTRSYFDGEVRRGERIDVSQPLKRTAACLGFDVSIVKKVCKTSRDGVELPSDDSDEERNRERIVSKTIYPVVRSAFFGMYREKRHVTLDSLLKALETQRGARATSWVQSQATLHRTLTQEMPLTYGAHPNHYKATKKKHSITLQRLEYTQHVRRYHEKGRVVFYRGETWVTKNMTPPSVWLNQRGDGGVKVPSGTGMRSIVRHVGNGAGFVPGAELIFRGENALLVSDYHSGMNSFVSLDSLEKKVFPAIPPRSVVVTDRATYHTTLPEEPKPANSTLRKISRPELNPIEMVWAAVKTHVAKKNTTFTSVEVERLTRERIHELGSAEWAKYVHHAVKVEDEYYDASDDIPFEASEK